jgi:signal transduction histidine kinase
VRRRLVLAFTALVAMVVIAFVVPLGLLVRSVARDRAVTDAEAGAQAAVPLVVATRATPALAGELAALGDAVGGSATFHLADGTTAGAGRPPGDWLDAARQGRAFVVDAGGGVDVVVPVVTGPGPADVLVVHLPGSTLREGVTVAWLLLGAVGLGLLVVAVVVGDRMARGVVRPSEDLARVAARLERGELDERVEPAGPPELEQVGHALNLLAGRIQDMLRAERESVADLSHRLRTPLTALRLDAEALGDDEERARVAAGVDEVSATVDQVIRSARRRAEAPLRPRGDLAAVAQERVAHWSPLAEDQDRALRWSIGDGPAWVGVTPEDLEAAVDALVGNVFAHTPEGCAFSVDVEPLDAGRWRLVVEDEGPGFAGPGLVGRGRSGADSTGLGLDIARRTAEATGGALRVGHARRGGARVEAVFGPPAP